MEWTVALVSARDVAPRQGERTDPLLAPAALALIVSSRFWEYDTYRRTDESLPQVLGAGPTADLPMWRLVQSSGRALLTGSLRIGVEELRQLSGEANIPEEMRAIAAVIASIGFADLEEPVKGAELCDSLLRQVGSSVPPLTAAVLAQQASLRYAESERYGEATALGIDARELLARVTSDKDFGLQLRAGHPDSPEAVVSKIVYGLTIAVEDNASAFAQMTDDSFRFPSRSQRAQSQFWLEKSSDLGSMGELYLQEGFERQIRDPTLLIRPTVIGNEDTIGRLLHSHTVGCEVTGHWHQTRDAYALLGRERLLRHDKTTGNWSRDQGLSLLRRSGNVSLLEQALRLVHAEGPLGILAESVTRAGAAAQNLPSRIGLASLRAGGDLLSEGEVDRIIHSLLDQDLDRLGREPGGWYLATDPLWQTIASFAARVSQPDYLSFQMRKAAESGDAMVLQRVADVASRLRWKDVSVVERDAWLAWSQSRLQGDSERLSTTVLGALVSTSPERSEDLLTSAFRRSPTPLLAATFVDLAAMGAREPLLLHGSAIADMCTTNMESTRRSAAEGSFGFGGVDLGLVAVALAIEMPRFAPWTSIVEFLTDRRVLDAQKASMLDLLADQLGHLPSEPIEKLLIDRSALTSTAVDTFMISRPTASVLRFLCAAGAIDAAGSIEELGQWARSSDPSGRSEAAESAVYVSQVASAEAVIPLLLGMSGDPAVVVRAAAGRSLAALAEDPPVNLREPVVSRLRQMLGADGFSEPVAVIHGLNRAFSIGADLPDSLIAALSTLQHEHISPTLRGMADGLLTKTPPS